MAAPCPNCDTPLPDPRPRFCGACGQETNVRPPTLGEFVQQFGGAYFSTEGALWRTLGLLLARPGELTRRYLAGRRKHYVLPLRLYLTISLAVLLLLRVAAPGTAVNLGRAPIPQVADLEEKPNVVVFDFGEGRGVGLKDGTFVCEGLPAWVCERFRDRLDLDRKSLLREVKLWPERFMSRWGTAMFLLVPIFALLTMLAHLGRGLRYTEHLVYALHLHSFWFLAVAVALLPVPGAGLALAAMPVYALLAARRVYGGGWLGTLARAGLVAVLYGVVLGVALGIVALWAFFFS
jgi:hypothetical protein